MAANTIESQNPFGYGDRPATADFDGSEAKHATRLPVDATPWDIAADVNDPEIPLLSIADLGILRDVAVDGSKVVVTIMNSGRCRPAMAKSAVFLTRRAATRPMAIVSSR